MDADAGPPSLIGTATDGDLVEGLGVFVSARASDDGDGTRVRPFKTIAKGIEVAKGARKRVYVCDGTYGETIRIANGIAMVGGLDCSKPKWSVGTGRSRVDAPSSPAIVAEDITSPTRFERFDVVAPDATAPSASSIGLMATGSPGLVVAKARIAAGDGAPGLAGAAAVQLTQVGPVNGLTGKFEDDYCAGKAISICKLHIARDAGGTGGASVCDGAGGNNGETGGTGGSGGVWEPYSPAIGIGMWRVYAGDSAQFGTTRPEARTGQPGAAGADGASAAAPGTITREGYMPADGVRGGNGAPGRGGQGGIALKPMRSSLGLDLYTGTSGSGGGGGGCPGLAGGEGKGGGASIAAALFESPMTLEEVELVAKKGGDGGPGTFGSSPGEGGAGGGAVNGMPATAGGPGGRGGVAGVSGHGAGGSSFGLVHSGGAPKMHATTARAGAPGAGVRAMSETNELGAKTIPASAAGAVADVAPL